jgi:ribulose-5-phosphate 4-epimerase/fuculose-1-phosphate aldolase
MSVTEPTQLAALAAEELDVDAERLHRKQALAISYRLFAENGFEEGFSGHISVRDPERTDHFWMNPLGVPFAHIRASDLVLVSPDGTVVGGGARANRAGYHIHNPIYQARPDVQSIAHGHSVHGKAWSAFGRPLPAINQEACIFAGTQAVYEEFHGAVKDDIEGRGIAAALGPTHTSAILVNHGLLTAGASVEETVYRMIILDRTCEVQLLVQAAGEPRYVDEHVAADLASEGAPYCASCFAPLRARIVRATPDVLD